ncbi:hypothetical protein K788_0001170 (plasmid) [Paraburkholderia caribensis MBA4]|uniref:Uncharacterized protein n=1 Tax=Paraburkholderia caribensis MBA4 TaxID=1323664 RepID=A0A0P0RNQ3_9BURK|nr:hypothetical protein K788_0001170 [Paraburkholderia caribensis MBA4]
MNVASLTGRRTADGRGGAQHVCIGAPRTKRGTMSAPRTRA